MMSMPLVAENLTFSRQQQVIIDHLSFTVARGECLILTGPNGAGKSTTLQLLAGLLKPQKGHILINNIDLQKHPLLAKKHIGFLPEKLPLYYNLTVFEYLRLAATLRRIPKKMTEQILQQNIKQLNLIPYQHHIIGTLSKGTQQRVAIAQALLHDPNILILDEPTQGLDEAQVEAFQILLKDLKTRIALIMSTHYINEVKSICDKRLQFSHTGITFHDLRHRENRTAEII